jgi:general secretion pathway protein A
MDMYLDFYRLQRAPFPLTPDPTLFFVSPSHHAALDALTQGIATRQGLVVITGASGVGKTALVHAYLARSAAPQLTTLVLWQAPLSLMDLLALMARRLEVPVATDDLGALRTQMQQRFLHEAHLGRNVALIIDEAQHLPLETLDQVWELAHPPATRALPLQIVLVGQPALQHSCRAATCIRWRRHRSSRDARPDRGRKCAPSASTVGVAPAGGRSFARPSGWSARLRVPRA